MLVRPVMQCDCVAGLKLQSRCNSRNFVLSFCSGTAVAVLKLCQSVRKSKTCRIIEAPKKWEIRRCKKE